MSAMSPPMQSWRWRWTPIRGDVVGANCPLHRWQALPQSHLVFDRGVVRGGPFLPCRIAVAPPPKSSDDDAAMNAPERAPRIFDHVSETQLVKLTRDIIAIPSPNFGEGKVADYLAEYMRGMGLSVSMMDVPHPTDKSKSTKQPIGSLKGA